MIKLQALSSPTRARLSGRTWAGAWERVDPSLFGTSERENLIDLLQSDRPGSIPAILLFLSLLLPPFVRPVDLGLNVSSTPTASFYSSLLFVLEVHLIRRSRLGQRNRQRVWRRRWAPGQLVERIVEDESSKKGANKAQS